MRNKLLLSSVMLCLFALNVNAQETLSDLSSPKAPAYRVGISEVPEKQYIQAIEEKTVLENKNYISDKNSENNTADLTYADLSIKRISKEIAQELEYEETDMVADLSLLWQGAAVQSDTINFALYKLANPDADKPDEKSIKKILTTIASMSTLVGASMGSPIAAGSALIGGNILGIMSQDTKALNYKYTKVTDADMIILIRKVEDLQQKTVDLYYDYMSAKQQLEFANDLVKERQEKFELAQKNNAPRELVVITDAYYRTAMDKQRNAKSVFFTKRAALEQFVGNEAFVQFETELAARENTSDNNSQTASNKDDKKISNNYEETVKNIENYTSSINTVSASEQGYSEPQEENNPYTYNQKYSQEYFQDEDDDDNLFESITGLSSGIENIPEEEQSANKASKSSKKTKVKKIKKEKQTQKEPKVKEKKVKENSKKKSKVSKKTVEESKDSTTFVQQPKKYPKNSTKDLIFLHGQDKSTAKYLKQNGGQQINNSVNDNTQPVNDVVRPSVNDFGLPPLDEIKVPELSRGGYSIHSEYGEDYETPAFQY